MGVIIPTKLETLSLSIPKEDPKKLFRRIKPVKKFSDGYFFIKSPDPFSKDFLWVAEKGRKATRLKALVEIPTLHRILHKDQLRPAVYEVLVQIPVDLLEIVSAFEIDPISWQNQMRGINKHCAMGHDCHVALTTLYVRP